MGDRYRYSRPRSPSFHNPARASLPIILNQSSPEQHLHAVPTSRREVIPGPVRSSATSASGGVTTTTYKIKADPASPRTSSTREPSRTRRSTLDSTSGRPAMPNIVTAAPRHRERPVTVTMDRAGSPLRDPYRSSEEKYYAIPASSRNDLLGHRKRYSVALDNADMHRLENEREGNRIHVTPREPRKYLTTRSQQAYPPVATRRADAVADGYGEDGYGYTNPRDLVQYDLNHNLTPRHHSRRLSFEGGRMPRPTSISGYNDIAQFANDPRDRRPPPTMRGFDRLPGNRATTWEQPQSRLAAPAPVAPVERPSRMDPLYISEPRRSGSRRPERSVDPPHEREYRRPVRDDGYVSSRDDYGTSRNDESRESRHKSRRQEAYEDPIEQRSVRSERSDRYERAERPAPLRSDRGEELEEDRPDHKHSRDTVAAGLSVAGAALGANVARKSRNDEKDDRDDRDERMRREYEDESRRRRETRDERSSVDISGRDLKERRSRDEDRATPSPRESIVRERPSDRSPADSTVIDLSGRDPQERISRPDRLQELERHRRGDFAGSAAIDSDSSASDGVTRSRRASRAQAGSSATQMKFNPNDTMDLRALKDALNSKDTSRELVPISARSPRGSSSHDAQQIAEIREQITSREGAIPSSLQLRVVSPPRSPPRADEKPVKGILRAPREKFPEDPVPIREGVAPLKDANKDGVPPDARWTKIMRSMVSPAALEAGKERFEARDDFVIVLRVLSRDEVQAYAEVTQKIRAAREEAEIEYREQRRRRRHERSKGSKHERSSKSERKSHSRRERKRHEESSDESDSTDDADFEDGREKDTSRKDRLVIEDASRQRDRDRDRERSAGRDPVMSGGLGDADGRERKEVKEMSERVNGV